MSFSGKVKEEIAAYMSKAKHCRLAELSAIISCCCEIEQEEDFTKIIKFTSDNLTVATKYSMLIKKSFKNSDDVDEILRQTKEIPKRTCCYRAYIRGMFLCSGSVTNPEKGYHLEIVTSDLEQANLLCEMMQVFDVEGKITTRKRNYVVYVKEGAQIVDLLNVMEAHVALMDYENVRIVKEVRNSVNRQVNCETANINKTVSAASRQMEDIMFIRDTKGFGTLTKGLAQIANIRLENPDASLKELGEMLTPPIGKSGVNHRLRKLSEIAEGLRENSAQKMEER